MLVTVFHPVFDARDFFPERACKTRRPTWPNLTLGAEGFQRNLGPIRQRRLGGIRGWASETDICEIGDSVRVERTRAAEAPDRHVFTRFFSDGFAAGYFSLGFEWNARPGASPDLQDIIQVLRSYEVTTRHRAGVVTPFSSGGMLTELYASGTTKAGAPRALVGRVRSGPPLGIAEASKLEASGLLPAKRTHALQGGRFKYREVPAGLSARPLPVFALIGGRGAAKTRSTRDARIVLARLYLELFVFEWCLELLSTSQAENLDAHGRELLCRRIALCTERLTGRRQPNLIAAPGDYDALASVFSTLHAPGRSDVLLDVFRRLDPSPNLRAAVTQTLIYNSPGGVFQMNNGDSYTNYGNAGAFGSNASASNFTQASAEASGPVNYAALEEELGAVLEKLREQAATPEQFSSLAAVSEAKEAAAEKDDSKVMSALKKAGKWALDTATDIGAKVASETLKGGLGL